MPVGVLGGAFNPPHIGHVVLAQEAAAQLELDQVHLVPTGRAPHKEIAEDPGMEARLEMASAAVAGNEMLRVNRFEIEAAARGDGPSYTVATLEFLAEEEDDLVLLMGADAAVGLEGWHEPRRVVELASIAVAARVGADVGEANSTIERLGGAGRVEVVRMPALEVSSTSIRRRVAEGRPVRYLVPDGVLELIEAAGLYSG